MKATWRQRRDLVVASLPGWRRGRRGFFLGLGLIVLIGGFIPLGREGATESETRMELFTEAGPFERTGSLWSRLFSREEIVPAPEPVFEISDYLAGMPHGTIIFDAASEHDVDPLLVLSVVEAESGFRPDARSSVGAVGLMQLMPSTGEWMGAEDLLDPIDNIFAGTRYLKYLEKRFQGDLDRQLAAYNAGEGNVMKYGGIPPFRETRQYISRVLSNYDRHVSEFESHRQDEETAAP